MRPIILQTDKEGFVKIKTNELKKMFDDVYNEGYKDGQNSYWWTYTTPSWKISTTNDLTSTGNKKWWDDMQITCNTDQFASTISATENDRIIIKGVN